MTPILLLPTRETVSLQDSLQRAQQTETHNAFPPVHQFSDLQPVPSELIRWVAHAESKYGFTSLAKRSIIRMVSWWE